MKSLLLWSLFYLGISQIKVQRSPQDSIFLFSPTATNSHCHTSGTFKVLSPLMVFPWPGHCLYTHKLWAGHELGPVDGRYALKPWPLSQALCCLMEQRLLLRSTHSWRLSLMQGSSLLSNYTLLASYTVGSALLRSRVGYFCPLETVGFTK